MSEEASTTDGASTHVEWMWQSNPDPRSKTQEPEWRRYSDVENLIIEKAFSTNQTHAIMDDYCIDFECHVQISTTDQTKQRPVKRLVYENEDTHSREERFLPDPIAPKRPFGGQYGWVTPFIKEVRKSLNLKVKQLPSKDESVVPMILEKAAQGIVEEGKTIGRQREGEEMAAKLMAQRDKGIKEIWKCCAYLYSLESFLYKKLNEAMRLIGSEEHEQVWRSKIRTLGPFCLLLWDNPFNNRLNKNIKVYRGAQLNDEQIATYQDLSARPEEYRSFQAFTSCSRDRKFAEEFENSNVLFIMEVEYAFTVDLSQTTEYPEEAEELITPEADRNQLATTTDQETASAKNLLLRVRDVLRDPFLARRDDGLDPAHPRDPLDHRRDLLRRFHRYRARYRDRAVLNLAARVDNRAAALVRDYLLFAGDLADRALYDAYDRDGNFIGDDDH